MNKRVENFRVGQMVELSEAKKSLNRLTNAIAAIYQTTAWGSPEREALNSELTKMNREETRLTKLIEFLETELLEKKYANHIAYSDINPFEVIEEKTPTCFVIRSMKAEETNESRTERMASFVPGGFCGHFDNDIQNWNITSDENGYRVVIRRHKDNMWYDKSGNRYSISDSPIKFYDFNF